MRGTHYNHTNSDFTKLFSNTQHLKHILQMIFQTTPAISNARCCCTEYYKYSQILRKCHTWLEIQNSITIIHGYFFGISKFVSTFYIFYMLRCLHSIIHCKFYTLTNQSLLLWHKYLESLGKNNVFTHVFFCSMSWRTNTQKDHYTTIQRKQQIM